MNRQEVIILVIFLIIAGFIGFTIGSIISFNFCADVGLNVLRSMKVVINVTNTEIIGKLYQHLDQINGYI